MKKLSFEEMMKTNGGTEARDSGVVGGIRTVDNARDNKPEPYRVVNGSAITVD